MRYSLLAGGKRLRPVLALTAADAVAPGDASAAGLAMPAACAIEMIHTYSLIHDDLPAMDNDTMRRGKPTLHVVHGEGVAILAGDGLLAEAFALLAREPDDEGRPDIGARKLAVIRRIADAAGAEGMVGGQAIDLQAVGQRAGPNALDADGLKDMHARKTGALIRAAAVAGAIMAGAPPARVGRRGSLRVGARPRVPDRRRRARRRGRRPGARQDHRQGRRGRQADLPVAVRAGRVEAHGAGGRGRGGGGPGRRAAASAAGSPRSPSGWSPAPRSPAEPWPPSLAAAWTCASWTRGWPSRASGRGR